MIKNTASQKIGAQLVSATDGSEFTGSVTVYVCGDAGTQAAGSVGSGACTHEGHGYHTYAPAQAETNYDLIAFTFVGTGAITTTVQVYTSVNANVLSIAGTAQTARDLGASVLLSSGTGTGQVKLSSGYIAPNWGDVGNPTTTVGLTGTTIATTQKVDVETIKTNPVVNAGTITFPTGATLASTTNITAGTMTTTTNLTNAPSAGDFTATMKTSIGTAVAASAVASVTGNVGGNVTGSVGSVVGAVGSVTGNVGGNVTGSIGSLATQAKADVNAEADSALADVGVTTTVTGRIDAAISTRLASASYTAPDNSAVTAIKAKTDPMTYTVSGFLDVNTQYINDVQLAGDGAGTPMTHV